MQRNALAAGFAWYELDANWMGICTLRALRLVWDVKLPHTRNSGLG